MHVNSNLSATPPIFQDKRHSFLTKPEKQSQMDFKKIGAIGNEGNALFVHSHEGLYYWIIAQKDEMESAQFDSDDWEEISEELYSELMKMAL